MKSFYSPLRYPGGKSKILSFMKTLIVENFTNNPPTYIEAYAGGAAVGLGLLLDGYVSDIYINDIDPAIYSFWHSVLTNHNRFIDKIMNIDISVDEWRIQSNIYAKGEVGFELGFATFYLNRCNRSGILKAGCIGGYKQEGNYKIDCRFNKIRLIERIENISKFRNRIHLFSEDTAVLLKRRDIKAISKKSIFYFDPPYYVKGKQLYHNYYTHGDHSKISSLIKQIKTYWVLSYDNVPEIIELYEGFSKREFNLTYYAGNVKKGKEVMFFSNNMQSIPSVN